MHVERRRKENVKEKINVHAIKTEFIILAARHLEAVCVCTIVFVFVFVRRFIFVHFAVIPDNRPHLKPVSIRTGLENSNAVRGSSDR